jgi:hypothetical protein
MFNTIVGAGAVEAGAASRYSSGSDQKMRLLAALALAPAPAPQHCLKMYLLSLKANFKVIFRGQKLYFSLRMSTFCFFRNENNWFFNF